MTLVAPPYLSLESTGQVFSLTKPLTTVGRANDVDVVLADPSVSRLHAEIRRLGPFAYVDDLGLSTNGTRVNGRPIGRRLLADGDVISFGTVRMRVGGLAPRWPLSQETGQLRHLAAPDLTPRELEVLTALCEPALRHEAFVAPASVQEIAGQLVVTEAAVKQHLLRLYQKFAITEGLDRRSRLANHVVESGVVRLLPAIGGPVPERRLSH